LDRFGQPAEVTALPGSAEQADDFSCIDLDGVDVLVTQIVENATKPYLARNRKFESVSLQRRVRRERSPAPC